MKWLLLLLWLWAVPAAADQSCAPTGCASTVEQLPTNGAAGTAPVSDGAGSLTMTDIATQAELDATTAGSDIEDHPTSGLIGTAPLSDGDTTLTMTDVLTEAELASEADLETQIGVGMVAESEVATTDVEGHSTSGGDGTAPLASSGGLVMTDVLTPTEGDAAYRPLGGTIVTTPAELDTCLEAGTNQHCMISGDPFVAGGIQFSPPRATNSGLISNFKDAVVCGANNVDVNTSAAHGFSNDDEVRIANTANYDGWYTIQVFDSDTFCLDDADIDTYPGDETGTYQVENGTWSISCLPGTRILWLEAVPFIQLWDTASNNQFHDNKIQVDLTHCNAYYPYFNAQSPAFFKDTVGSTNANWVLSFSSGTLPGGVDLSGAAGIPVKLELTQTRLESWPVSAATVTPALNLTSSNEMQIVGGELICVLRDDKSNQSVETCNNLINAVGGKQTYAGMKYTNFNGLKVRGDVTWTGNLMTENIRRDDGGHIFFVQTAGTNFAGTANVLEILEGQSSTDGYGDSNTLLRVGNIVSSMSLEMASVIGCPDITIALENSSGLPDRFLLDVPYEDGCNPHLARSIASTKTQALQIIGVVDANTVGGAVGDIRIETSATHGIDVNDYVLIKGTTHYETSGVPTQVTVDVDATHFDVTDTFVSTQTGSVQEVDDSWQHLNANSTTVADLIFPDRSIHIENGEVHMTVGGQKESVMLCGKGGNAATVYMGPVFGGVFGDAACDASEEAAVATADEPAFLGDRIITGFECTIDGAAGNNDTVDMTLYVDTAAWTGATSCNAAPQNYCDATCTITLNGDNDVSCRAELYAPSTLASRGAIAVEVDPDDDDLTTNDIACTLFVENV